MEKEVSWLFQRAGALMSTCLPNGSRLPDALRELLRTQLVFLPLVKRDSLS